MIGLSAPMTLPAEFDHVAGRAVEDADDVAGRVEHGRAVDEVGHGAHHVPDGVEDLAGQRVEDADHVAGGVEHVAGHRVEDAEDLAVGADHARAVHQVGDRADEVAGRVDDHAGGLVERAEDVAVRGRRRCRSRCRGCR